MTDPRLIGLVRSAHDALSAILDDAPNDAAVVGSAHLVDRLGVDGLWTPDWLAAENAPYAARADGLGNIGPVQPDGDGGLARGKLLLASGFYFDKCLERKDLTPLQAETIHQATQWAGGALLDAQRDEVTGYIRMTWRFRSGWDEAGVQRPGAHPLALGFGRYENAVEVRAAYRRLLQLSYDT